MITHREAVEAAILLDKYCNEIKDGCVCGSECVFGGTECPFEFGTPYYEKQDREEMLARAELMDLERSEVAE